MDYRTLNFDWNRAKAFLVTAEKGSYSAAAKALNLTQSTLGRQVQALEHELGVVLFERTGKGIQITPIGLDLIEHVKTMAEGASKLSLAAMGQSEDLEGLVTITASEAISAFQLPQFVKKIRNLAPGIKIEIVARNESADLRKREADIAVRNYRPKQPDLIMKKVSDAQGNFYATKEFIKNNGPFKTIKDLSKANFVSVGDLSGYIEGLKPYGLNLTKDNFSIMTESHFVHWNLVKDGLGIGIMPNCIGDKDKSVEKVLKSFKGINFSTWIVSHRELKTNRRIRFVFDQLVEYFS
ncbi:LysR family transcriptional regulator [Bacteriovorax sp. Seq25_V]|uniref:LysR family transcriptional regulator n=1 Tax=Bacteriovorax sp. Seq25_V TaxID=1201288 RepID=UPI00038A2C7E|nr:LysR family transcriptional regulator [Bacteriovorax sp. Seq25_V]EQC47198.1 transcriptional regulator, LysR family [Bacteriovorax sp. Seq25_V]